MEGNVKNKFSRLEKVACLRRTCLFHSYLSRRTAARRRLKWHCLKKTISLLAQALEKATCRSRTSICHANEVCYAKPRIFHLLQLIVWTAFPYLQKKRHYYHSQKVHTANNILSGDFTINNASTKWVTDISYIYTVNGVYSF